MSKKVYLPFITPMVAAILAGSKTQTRRLRFTGGEAIWVKEVFAEAPPLLAAELNRPYLYKTDMERYRNHPSASLIRWKSWLFMPDKAVRMKLPIKSVRTEPIQSISITDAIAEGIEHKQCTDALGTPYDGYKNYGFKRSDPLAQEWFFSPILSFESLWNSLHRTPPHTWKDNPEVYVVEFENSLHLSSNPRMSYDQ